MVREWYEAVWKGCMVGEYMIMDSWQARYWMKQVEIKTILNLGRQTLFGINLQLQITY
jgi:hypothetical protein